MKALRGGKSGSRSPSGSAGAAPRRRAFSSLMLQGSLSSFRLFRAAFNQPGMLCFLIKEFCKAFWGFRLIRFTLVACACLRRPSAQREGVRAAPPHGRLLPPHLFKTSTRHGARILYQYTRRNSVNAFYITSRHPPKMYG